MILYDYRIASYADYGIFTKHFTAMQRILILQIIYRLSGLPTALQSLQRCSYWSTQVQQGLQQTCLSGGQSFEFVDWKSRKSRKIGLYFNNRG